MLRDLLTNAEDDANAPEHDEDAQQSAAAEECARLGPQRPLELCSLPPARPGLVSTSISRDDGQPDAIDAQVLF